jgi:hypothetical protein
LTKTQRTDQENRGRILSMSESGFQPLRSLDYLKKEELDRLPNFVHVALDAGWLSFVTWRSVASMPRVCLTLFYWGRVNAPTHGALTP